MTEQKPTLGVTPKWFYDEQRKADLGRAIYDYLNAQLPINPDWITEYNALCENKRV